MLTARALRGELARVRRTHSNRTVWEVAQDAYVAVFTAVLLGSMVGSVFVNLVGSLTSCDTTACDIARNRVPVVVLLGVAGATVRVLAEVGPVVASRAVATWLLSTPTSRRDLLIRPFALASVVAALAAAAAFAAAAAVSGVGARALLASALVGLALGAAAAALTTLAQPRASARRSVRAVGDALLLAGVVALAWVAFGGPLGGIAELESPYALPLAVVIVAAAGAVVVRALGRLGRLGLSGIVSGGELLVGLAGAAYSLDLGLVGEIVASRRFRVIGARRSVLGRLSGPAALVERDLRRLARYPGRVVTLVALGLLPLLCDRVGLTPVAPVVAGFAGYLAVRWSASGLRRVWRSEGLRRSLPFDLSALLLCYAAAPAILAIAWSAAAATALPGPWPVAAAALALAVVAGVVRAAASRPPTYGGALVAGPMGAVPPGLFAMVVRGPDAALAGTVALAAGAPPLWSVAVPAVLLAIVLAMAPASTRPPRSWLSPDVTPTG